MSEVQSKDQSTGEFGWGTLIRDPIAITIVLMMFLNGIVLMPTMGYLMSFLREEIGYSVESAGWVWSTSGFVGMFGGFFMGALADKITVTRSLIITYLLLAISTFLILNHASYGQVVVGAGLFGLTFMAIFGLIPAFISLKFDANTAITVFALSNVMQGLGGMLGNLLGGLLRDQQQSFVPVYTWCLWIEIFLVGLSFYLQRSNRIQISRAAPVHAIVTE